MLIKTIYRYNQHDNSILAQQFLTDGVITTKQKYISTFDDDGNQTRGTYCDDKGIKIEASYNYVYDAKKQLVSIETYNSKEIIYHKVIYTYDSRGKMAVKSASGPNGAPYEKITSTCETDKRTEERVSYKNNGALQDKNICIYDNKDNLIEVTGYDLTDSILGKTCHAYLYDLTGNWIKKISQSLDVITGKPTATWIEQRSINYY